MSHKNIDLEVWMDIQKEDSEGNLLESFEVLVRGEYTPACRGSRDYYGQPIEPDEPYRVEFLSAERENGKEIELNKGEMRRAESLLENAIPYLD